MRPIEPASGWSVDEESHLIDAADLALTLVVNFRAHPHICNVMTHVSDGNWTTVEKALEAILDLKRADTKLSRLAENIVELACAERGVTGRILKPFLAQLLAATLPAESARAVLAHVEALFIRISEPQAVPAPAALEDTATPQWILVAQPDLTNSLGVLRVSNDWAGNPAILRA